MKLFFLLLAICASASAFAADSCALTQTVCGSSDGEQGATSGCSIECFNGATAQCRRGKIDLNGCQVVSDDSCQCIGGWGNSAPPRQDDNEERRRRHPRPEPTPSSECFLNKLSCGSSDGSRSETSGCSIKCYNQSAVCKPGEVFGHGQNGCELVRDDDCYCK
jgi:hypothetical protein